MSNKKNEKKEEVKKTDEEILFPEAKVGDLIIKPWSFGMLFDISSLLEKVIDKAEEKGLIDNLEKDVVTYTTLAKLFAVANNECLELIALTLGLSQEEVKEFDMTKGVKVAMIIFMQNKESIKNALAPLFK